MVSLHSTYSGSGADSHGHHHHFKKRKKKDRIPDLDLLTRTSWTDAEIGRLSIQKVRL